MVTELLKNNKCDMKITKEGILKKTILGHNADVAAIVRANKNARMMGVCGACNCRVECNRDEASELYTDDFYLFVGIACPTIGCNNSIYLADVFSF